MTTNSGKQTLQEYLKKHKAAVVTVVILLVLSILMFFAVILVTPVAEKQLLDIANRELAPNAHIEIDDFSLGIFPVQINIEGIRLVHSDPFEEQVPDKPLDTIRKLNIQSATLSGVRLIPLIMGKEWSLGTLNIDGVDAEFVPTTSDKLTDSAPLEQPLDVTISDINISNSDLKLFEKRDSEQPTHSAAGISLQIENFSVTDSENPLHTYFEHFTLSINSAEHKTEDDYYQISAEQIKASSRDETLSVNRFEAIPQLSAYEMASEFGNALDVYTVEGGPFTVSELRINQWFESNDIHAGYVELNDLAIIIEREKSFDRAPRDDRPLLNNKLKNLSMAVQADSVRWQNGKVSYTEQFSDDDRSGTVLFSDINLLVEALQNRDENQIIPVIATTRFMDAADLEIKFEFYANDLANHTIQATLHEMDLTHANDPLENLASVRVSDGLLTSLDFTFTASDERADGEMLMIYDDLSLRLLDEESLEENRGTRFRSFFANTFAVRSSNNGDDPRTGTMEFEREKDRSTFNYWWKTIRSGLKDTVQR